MKVPKKSGYAKFRQVMRISMIQVTMALMCGGLSMAATNHAQLLDRNISISLSEIAFTEALKEIESRANITFVYSVDQLSDEMPVTLQATDKPLREILDQLLTPRHISYKVYEKDKTLSLKKQLPERQPAPKFRDRANTQIQDDRLEVSGTVTDATTQQPMPGVNILIKGTTAGTTTDAKGQYNLEARDEDVLIFSFIGYSPQEIPIQGRTIINVVLSEDIVSLKDVVINAGYYNTTKLTQTGNISKVTAEEIARQPVQNPLAALQGRVPGLEVTQSTGVPGGNFRLRIRGTNSIANGNDPLFIIDGVPYTSTAMTFNETSAGILGNSLNPLGGSSPFNNLNPADIESIEVLKDADATAIYGSRGSNGVILITTKKGLVGKTKVDVNFYSGAGKVANRMELLNTQQYVAMRNEAFKNDNTTPTAANARDLILWDTIRHTDWQKELIGGTANTTDVQVSLSGGNETTQFSVGLGYHRETTVFPGNNSDQRLSSRINISNQAFNEKLKTSITLNYTTGQSDLLNQDITDRSLYLAPNAPNVLKDDGELNWEGWNTSGILENPLAYTKRRYEAISTNLIGSLELAYTILPKLELKSRFGISNAAMESLNLIPISSLSPAIRSSSLNTTYFSESKFSNWVVEPQANWKFERTPHAIDVLVGTQFLNQRSGGLAQMATGFTSEALMMNISSAPNRSMGTNHNTQYRYHGIFGRLNYTFRSKFILNITGRRDGSSRFGPGKQFANFGALGTAWIFSEEPLIKSSFPFLSFGKLRASYGTSGNDQLNDYQYLDAYSSSVSPYQGIIGLTPVRLSNPVFAWESNKKLEAALELSFLRDRIISSLSFYRNRSSNQLVGYPLPPSTGFSSIQANFPAVVQNQGVEIELTTINKQNTTFSWVTSWNISFPSNKLIDFPNIEMSADYANRFVVGESLNIVKLYKYQGIDPTSGLYQVEDSNNDGLYNQEDRSSINFLGQYFFGGLNNSLSLGGFDLDFHIQFVKQDGRKYYVNTGPPGFIENQPISVLSRWEQEGDEALHQRFGWSTTVLTPYQRAQSSTHSMMDASFIRLKNISLSYNLPQDWLGKARITQLRLFINAQNLFTITKYDGLDPERQSLALPPLRLITGGFSVTL